MTKTGIVKWHRYDGDGYITVEGRSVLFHTTSIVGNTEALKDRYSQVLPEGTEVSLEVVSVLGRDVAKNVTVK